MLALLLVGLAVRLAPIAPPCGGIARAHVIMGGKGDGKQRRPKASPKSPPSPPPSPPPSASSQRISQSGGEASHTLSVAEELASRVGDKTIREI